MEHEATFVGKALPSRLTIEEHEAQRLVAWLARHKAGKLRFGEGTLTIAGTSDGKSVLARLTGPEQFVTLDPPLAE